jgi:hypothetical protein
MHDVGIRDDAPWRPQHTGSQKLTGIRHRDGHTPEGLCEVGDVDHVDRL